MTYIKIQQNKYLIYSSKVIYFTKYLRIVYFITYVYT